MPPPTMDIRMIKDVLRLKLHGRLSHEAVARSVSISKGVVAKYVSLANASGLDNWEAIAGLGEAELLPMPNLASFIHPLPFEMRPDRHERR